MERWMKDIYIHMSMKSDFSKLTMVRTALHSDLIVIHRQVYTGREDLNEYSLQQCIDKIGRNERVD